MQYVDINILIDKDDTLYENIPNNIIITGRIDFLCIKYKYQQLNLYNINCIRLWYENQEGESIENHILPNILQYLNCPNNKLTSLPNLPNSLQVLDCSSNKLTSLPNLPNDLEYFECCNNKLTSLPNLPNDLDTLLCDNNRLISIPQLPNSLRILYCNDNLLLSLPDLPNSLESLWCNDNKLKSFPELPNNIRLMFRQDEEIEYIPYCKNVKIYHRYFGFKIKDYPVIITNQKTWDEYMEYQFHKINNVKSARK